MRILIIDTSRYNVLILRRELLKKYPKAVISYFFSLDSGVEELTRASYDAAILSLSLLAQRPAATSRLLELLEQEAISPALVLIKSSSDLEGLAQLMIAGSTGEVWVMETEPSWHKLVPGVIAQITSNSTRKTRPDPVKSPSELPMNPAGRLAHEINNPLMTILGATELVLGKPDQVADEVLRKLRIIRRSAYRIKNYLDQHGINDDHLDPRPNPAITPRGQKSLFG